MAVGAADDAARGAIKLVKWLAGKGDDVAASAEDIANFGPSAERVQSLLSFLPTRSDEAKQVSRALHDTLQVVGPRKEAYLAAKNAGRSSNVRLPLGIQPDVLIVPEYMDAASRSAAFAEAASDLIDPQTYRTLTNPLAAGRAVDVLRTRPRLENTRFLDIARQAAARGAVSGPRDIVAVSRIAQAGEDVQDIALALMGDGMPAEQAMRTARMLAQ